MLRCLGLLTLVALGSACGGDHDEIRMSLEPGVVVDDAGALPLPVGLACDLTEDCGESGECLKVSSTGTSYPGGYCTAACTSSAECGPDGECPVAEALVVEPSFKASSTWPRSCFHRCTPGAVGDCREGYECRSLAKSYGIEAKAPEPMQRTVCLPVLVPRMKRDE